MPRPENYFSQVLNFPENVSLSQLDQDRKVEIINSDKSSTSLPNEPRSPQSPSYSQCHHNKTVTDKIYLESLESYNPEPADKVIDYLIGGKETVIPENKKTCLNLISALHQEVETRNLRIVNLI